MSSDARAPSAGERIAHVSRYPPHVIAPELSVLQLKLFTRRTASIVSDPRPKSALETDTPPFVVLNTLVLSVLICACTTSECVPTPTLGSRKLKLCAEVVSRTSVISSGVSVQVVGLAAHLAGENEPEVRRQRLDPLIEDDPLAKIWQRPVVGAGAIVLTSSAGRVE